MKSQWTASSRPNECEPWTVGSAGEGCEWAAWPAMAHWFGGSQISSF